MDGGWAASHLCKRGGIPTPCVSIWACYGILLLHYAPRSKGQRDCLEGFFLPYGFRGAILEKSARHQAVSFPGRRP